MCENSIYIYKYKCYLIKRNLTFSHATIQLQSVNFVTVFLIISINV